jgi:surface antigen
MYVGEQTNSQDAIDQLDFNAPDSQGNALAQQNNPSIPAPSDEQVNFSTKPAMAAPKREPIFVPGTGKKSPGTLLAPKIGGGRAVVHAGATVVLVAIVLGVLIAVVPSGNGQAFGLGTFFKPSTSVVTSTQNKTALIASQAATATAVTQDGYDAGTPNGGTTTYAGVQSNFALPGGLTTNEIAAGDTGSASSSGATTGGGLSANSDGTLGNVGFDDYFSAGQCTYWADYEYHRLTGYAVTWSGNAMDWAAGAAAAGWVVSSTPKVYSIIVLQPGVQGAGAGYGHVGVVESINADGSVNTTNWNVVGYGVFSWETYKPGPGVSFIWHP